MKYIIDEKEESWESRHECGVTNARPGIVGSVRRKMKNCTQATHGRRTAKTCYGSVLNIKIISRKKI